MEVSSQQQHRQTHQRWVILLHSIPAVVTVIWSLIGAAVFWGEMIGTSWMVLLAWALLEGSFIIAKIVSWFGSRTVLASFHWVLPFISMLPIAHTVTAAVFSHPVSPYLGWTSVVLLVGMFGFVSWASWASLDQLLVDHVRVWEADTRSQVDMYASMVRISATFLEEMYNLYRSNDRLLRSQVEYPIAPHHDQHNGRPLSSATHDPSHENGRPLSSATHDPSHENGRPLSSATHDPSHENGRPLSSATHDPSHENGRPLSSATHDPSHENGRPLSSATHDPSHENGRPLSGATHDPSHENGRPLSSATHDPSHENGRPLSGVPRMVVINASSHAAGNTPPAVIPDGRLSIPNDARMVRWWYRCTRCHHVYDIEIDTTMKGQSAANVRWAKCPRCRAREKTRLDVSDIPEEVAV
jgi:rubredoxin